MAIWGYALCLLTMMQLSPSAASADSLVVHAPVVPFFPGEKFTYSVEYGFITAGKASLSVEGIDTLQNIPCYHFQSRAWSNPTFSPIFKVDDRVDSYTDIFRLSSLRLEKHLREGKYKKDLLIDFDPILPLAYYPEGDTLETTPDTQDALSSLYYLRLQELKVGRTISIPHHDNKKNYPLEIRVLRKERIKVPAGKFTCFVIQPFLKDEGIFKSKGKINIWITDDEKKIPVLVKSSVIIGSVSAKLEKYEPGTAVDLTAFKPLMRDTVPDSGCADTDLPLETGGNEYEIPPQDAGSQEDKDVPVRAEEEPGKGW